MAVTDVTSSESTDAQNQDSADTNDSKSLWRKGFLALISTAFMGAANDNIVKTVITYMLASGVWTGAILSNPDGEAAIPAVCLTIPFILLSGYAGQLADRFSKRKIMLWVKIAEIPLAILAFVAFVTFNVWLALAALVFLGIQSTFFGPAKFGSIPELVGNRHLSPANGALNLSANLGIMFGIMISGLLCRLYYDKDAELPLETSISWAPGFAILLVAIAGLIFISFMTPLKASKASLKFDWNPFSTYFSSLKELGFGPLFVVICAWSWFYLIGSMELIIIPVYGEDLDFSYVQLSALLLVLSIAIGIGSMVAGALSGKTIRPMLIPLGGVGMTIGFTLMGVLEPSFVSLCALLFWSGFTAGFYIVPLQALIQYLSPLEERGRFLGTASAMSMLFVTLGAGVVFVSTNLLGMETYRVNLICAVLSFVGMAVGIWQMKRVMTGRPAVVDPSQGSE